jgi:hypothetical protein
MESRLSDCPSHTDNHYSVFPSFLPSLPLHPTFLLIELGLELDRNVQSLPVVLEERDSNAHGLRGREGGREGGREWSEE